MKQQSWSVLFLALAAGCAGYSGAGLVPGQSLIEDVRAVMGEPTMVRNLPDGDQVLWYSKLPYGRESYAARIAPDGTLVSLEQRLTPENIAKLRPNALPQVQVSAQGPRILGIPALDRAGPADALRRILARQRSARGVPALRPRHAAQLPVSLKEAQA